MRIHDKIQIIVIAGVLMFGLLAYSLAFNAPSTFPEGQRFQVGEGESLYSVSERLEDENIINSALFFRGWISILGRDRVIDLGVYVFTTKAPLGVVVAKFVKGPDEPLLSVTIPEGYTTKDIAAAFKKAVPSISVDVFSELVQKDKLDGYLFPSTYYPLPSSTEKNIIERMTSTFDKEYAAAFGELAYPRFVPTQQEVITLASIIEGEANTPKDMKIVSGILQKRLETGMRLQVDVAEVTYRKSGIPEQPINNPGLIAIDAVFNPTANPYLYYLTGRDGKMYYSKTFTEHKKNIEKYLR